MLASQREKQTATIVVTLLVGWGLYAVANAEYFTPMDDLSTQQITLQAKVDDNKELFQKQKELTKLWNVMQTQGLRSDTSVADTQLYEALESWAAGAGLDTAPDLRRDPDRKAGEKSDFIVISYRVTADGTLRAISKLIWALETATIPVRVDNVTFSPQPEGTDHLQAHLEVSTLCMAESLGGTTTTKPAPALVNASSGAAPGNLNSVSTRPAALAAATTRPATQPAAAMSTTNPTGAVK